MASVIISESGAVWLHKIKFFEDVNKDRKMYVMECELGEGQGSDPWSAAIDMFRSIDIQVAELKKDAIRTLAAYADSEK